VIRRTAAGKSPFSADRKHLHHRMQNLGHSHRQSVLLLYLWAALFAGGLVGLSQLHISLIWLALMTAVMVAALLLATMPKLRPWNGVAAVRGGLPDPGPLTPAGLAGTGPAEAGPGETAPAGAAPAKSAGESAEAGGVTPIRSE